MWVGTMTVATTYEGYCAGSGRKPGRKGSKYVRGQLRWLCPDCGGHYAKDNRGYLRTHGYKLNAKYSIAKGVTSVCAQCRKKFEGVDYLCPKCRG